MTLMVHPTSVDADQGDGLSAAARDSIAKWRGLDWPAEETMLRALLRSGKSVDQVASIYRVEPVRIDLLKRRYGL